MLQFPENYFKTEALSGYLVGESTKRVWASQIEILHKISEICERHGLTYYIFWGSLLGAIRHQGFIPWDDDLDIAMLGEDYIRFLEVAAEELPEGYHIFNPYTEDELDIHFTRVTNRKEIDLIGSWSKEYHGCPLAMGIDIFPMYYIPRDKRMAEEQKKILTFVRKVRDIIIFRKANPEQTEKEKRENDLVIAQSLVDIQNMTGYQFTSTRPINRQLDVIFDQICRIATREESDLVASFDEYIVNNCRIYPIEYFENPVQLPFENIMVTAPKEYDAILSDAYYDYMVPRNFNKMEEHAAIRSQMQHMGKYVEARHFQKMNGGKGWTIRLQDIPRGKVLYEQAKDMLPMDWLKKIYVVNSEQEIIRKPVLLYYLSVDKLMFYCAHAVDKIKRTLETFAKQSDVVVWWVQSMQIEDMIISLKNFVPQMLEGYEKLVNEFVSEGIGIYDESGDILRAITMSDAYYGDEGILMPIYTKIGKPVMIQNYLV